MLISKKNNYIFISNPKTGTTFIQKTIKAIDGSAFQNRLNANQDITKIDEHTNAIKLSKCILDFKDYTKFVFIRNPYDKVISSYFFLRNGSPLTKGNIWAYRGSLIPFLRAVLTYFNILSAKLLPFKIWSLIRPIKFNEPYMLRDGKFIVNYIGIASKDRLNIDLIKILELLEIEFNRGSLNLNQKENTSSHKDKQYYFKEKSLHKALFDFLYRREILLYNKVVEKPVGFDFFGKHVDSL